MKKPNSKEDSKVLYLKIVNSPIYRKRIKTKVDVINDFNKIVRNNSLKYKDVLGAAKYFADDIRNPLTPRVNVESS